MTTNDDLRIGGPKPAPDWITSWVRNCEVRLGHEFLGYAWELPNGQWTTWASGPRFATVEEAAEHLRQQRLGGASPSGPLGGAENMAAAGVCQRATEER